MGYDLWIERKEPFSSDEWTYIQNTWPGVAEWIWFSNGRLSAKYPEPNQIEIMTEIAKHFVTRVVGDDGEIYTSGNQKPTYPKSSLLTRLRRQLSRLLYPPKIDAEVPPFAVGDRVMSLYRGLGTVVNLNPDANHGAGEMGVRFEDGDVQKFFFFAHELEKADEISNEL